MSPSSTTRRTRPEDEIGALVGATRWKIGRLLAAARERGIVRIEIVHPRARRLGIERELAAHFGLQDAVVVPSPASDDELSSRVAQAAADFLAALRPVPRVLGLSWGRTLSELAEHGARLGRRRARRADQRGVSLNRRPGTAANTASIIAQKAQGEATLLPSPAILERLETKRAIESDRTVAGVLELAASANAYLFSAGPADASSVLVDSGYLTPDDVAELVRRGAVGDVLGRFITADGTIVDAALGERTVGLGLEQLRSADTAIAVIAGPTKHDVARAVVTSGLCTVIVTDEATALSLLEGAA